MFILNRLRRLPHVISLNGLVYSCLGVALFEQMSQEAAGGVFVHASPEGVVFILFAAYATDFVVFSLRMPEYEAADACFRSHCITFRQSDLQVKLSRKQLHDVPLQRMVRT